MNVTILYIPVGIGIYTSLNKKKQKKLQKAVNDQLAGFKEKDKEG